MKSKDATTNDLAEAARLDQDAVRFHPEQIVASLDGLEVDHLGALAVSDSVVKQTWRVKPICILLETGLNILIWLGTSGGRLEYCLDSIVQLLVFREDGLLSVITM